MAYVPVNKSAGTYIVAGKDEGQDRQSVDTGGVSAVPLGGILSKERRRDPQLARYPGRRCDSPGRLGRLDQGGRC